MGFDEKLFAFGYRFFKKLSAEPPPPYFEQRAELKALEARLLLLSQTLSGDSVQVVQAEGGGGFSGRHFYFPEHICLFPDQKLNEQVYLHRAVFYCLARQEGLCLPSSLLSEVEVKLYTLLGIGWIHSFFGEEFPAGYRLAQLLGQAARKELQEQDAAEADTQNGILAAWLSQCLYQEFTGEPWTLMEAYRDQGLQGFWECGRCVFEKYLKNRRQGVALSEEAFALWGLLKEASPEESHLKEKIEDKADAESLASGTELQGKNRETVTEIRLQDEKEDPNPVMHTFEKMETLEEYQGGLRMQDGDDELQEHAEALEELNIREVVRSRERTQSIYKADIRMSSQAPDLLEENRSESPMRVHEYPEWDFKSRSYRANWCRVEVRTLSLDAGPFCLELGYQKELREIKKLFEQLRHKPIWKKRQREGQEFDLEAMVDRFATLKSGQSAEDRLYLRQQEHHKDWQCLILVDASLSTDSWVENERVLDVIKNSVGLLGEALKQEQEAISVAAFHSNTRHHCSYIPLKDFTQSWTHLKTTLGSLEPAGYTRIGPALRHATQLLEGSPARHKFVVLLSDGKASDYDQYEGRYGVEDIRQAVREAAQAGVHVKCLAIDEKAKFYLPEMFGQGQVRVLGNPRRLPGALRDLFAPLL